MADYRIKECCGRYNIEIRGYEEKGILWWKHKVWGWEGTNSWGGVHWCCPISQPYSKTYKTISGAVNQIAKWKAGFHYFDSDGNPIKILIE
jgi:hypothetical protein